MSRTGTCTNLCGRACTRLLGFQPSGLFTPLLVMPFPLPSSGVVQYVGCWHSLRAVYNAVESRGISYVQKHDSHRQWCWLLPWQTKSSKSCDSWNLGRTTPATQGLQVWDTLKLMLQSTLPTVPVLSSSNTFCIQLSASDLPVRGRSP